MAAAEKGERTASLPYGCSQDTLQQQCSPTPSVTFVAKARMGQLETGTFTISHGFTSCLFFLFLATLSCVGTKPWPRIKAVRAYVITADESGDQGADCHDVESDHWINGGLGPIANPMSGWV